MGGHPLRVLESRVTFNKPLRHSAAKPPLCIGEISSQRTKNTSRTPGCARLHRRTEGPQFRCFCFLLCPSPSPTPDIAWYKKGGDLPSDKAKFENFNKALRITNISEEDSGEYFCLASNKMGSIRHTISVRVKGTLCVFLIMMILPALNTMTTLYSEGGWGQDEWEKLPTHWLVAIVTCQG